MSTTKGNLPAASSEQALHVAQTEAALRLSEATRAAILQTALDCIVTIDHRGFVLDWNLAAQTTFGYSTEEAVGREMAELIIPVQLREMHRRGLARAVQTGKDMLNGQRIEISAVRRNGDEFPVELSITRVAGGLAPVFTGHIRDISARKQAEQRQAAQYAIVRTLAEAPDLEQAAPKILESVCQTLMWDFGAIWGLGSDGEALECSALWWRPGLELQRFAQATRESKFIRNSGLPGRIWKAAHPIWVSDVTADTNFPRAAMACESQLHGAFGFPICLGDHIVGIAEFFSRQIREPDERLLEMFSAIGSQIGQFIERKRVEQELRSLNKTLEERVNERTAELLTANTALRESEGRYRTLAERTPAAVVVMDTQTGRFIEMNENALKLFGMTREELLQVGPEEVSPAFQPDGRPSSKAAREKIHKALQGSTPTFEWVHRRADGTSVPCEVRVARMPAAGRELVIGAITDISVRKKAEAELRAALQQEKELSQLKTNFVSLVSHEFRTPLGVIMSGAEILENYFERLNSEQRAGHLLDIRHAARLMANLMEEVLLLGKVESGKMERRLEPMELHQFCQRLVDEQQTAAGARHISLELDSVPSRAQADEGLLRHILTNLLSNALKYSPPDTTVRFSVKREGVDALFEIADQGIGIPPEDQSALFEAFHRGRNVGEIPGTGLGMVIVKRCVDAHEGTIEFSSAVGRGTTFRVRLKLFQASKPKRKPRKRLHLKTR